MNRIRKLAEELVEKYPSLFSSNFESNKRALSQVAIIRSTVVRNQLAGAITTIMKERTPVVLAAATTAHGESSSVSQDDPQGIDKDDEITQAVSS